MDNNETPDAIFKEMRHWPINWRTPDEMPVVARANSEISEFADRLEAALKREQIGRDTLSDGRSLTVAVAEQRLHFARVEAEYAGMLNMAKARKALEAARAALSSYADGGDEDNAETNAVLAEIDAALAAPARNCDVGTPKEQSIRFHNFCRLESAASGGHCTGCSASCYGRDKCEFVWAQMPYEEGSAK